MKVAFENSDLVHPGPAQPDCQSIKSHLSIGWSVLEPFWRLFRLPTGEPFSPSETVRVIAFLSVVDPRPVCLRSTETFNCGG